MDYVSKSCEMDDDGWRRGIMVDRESNKSRWTGFAD